MRSRAMILASILAGCASVDPTAAPGGGGKSDGDRCEDAEYGDGVCHLALGCGVPDIDCYETFDSDNRATQRLRYTSSASTLSPDDSRHDRARTLAEKAWEIFRAERPVGDLAEIHLGVVVFDDANPNAWISALGTRVMFSVQMNTGLLDLPEEDALGVMFHELAHLVGLHPFEEVGEDMVRYYAAAPDGTEPLGAGQPDAPRVREYGQAWKQLAALAGPYSDMRLGGLSYGGPLGQLRGQLVKALRARGACIAELDTLRSLYAELDQSWSRLDGSVVVSVELEARIAAALSAADACIAVEGLTLREVLAEHGDALAVDIEDELTAAERPLLDAEVASAISQLVRDRRAAMREQEQAFERALGVPWSALRFFSHEEQADDISAHLTASRGHAAPGVSGIMLNILGEEAAECEARIASAQVPYGVDLMDAHHGICWRVAHARRRAGLDTPPLMVAPTRSAFVPGPVAYEQMH